MMRNEVPTLDCQTCGEVVRRLSPAEAQEVSWNPYNFIVFCRRCREYAVEAAYR